MKITKHVYFYSSPGKDLVEPSGTVIIRGKDKQVIIDPGTNVNKRLDILLSEIKKDGLDIDKTSEIWLTHAHPDHFQMIHDLYERFEEKIRVRCHLIGQNILAHPAKESFWLREMRGAGKYWKIVFSKKMDKGVSKNLRLMTKRGLQKIPQKITNTRKFSDGEILEISPIKVRVVFLPGHTPDEVGFWIAKEKVLILGDLVNISQYKGGEIDCKLILYNFYADLNQSFASLQKMKQIKEKKLIKVFFKKPEVLLTPHSAPLRGAENIQRVFDQLISKTDNYKAIEKEFIKKNPNFSDIQLVRKLAEEILDGDLPTEKRFIALATLRSSGEIARK